MILQSTLRAKMRTVISAGQKRPLDAANVHLCRGGDGGGADHALEGGNLDLALSRMMGYAVLGFAGDGDDLVFDGPVECDSFRFERRGGRNVLTFGMRAAAAGGEEDDCDKPGPEAEKTLRAIEAGHLPARSMRSTTT